MYELRSPLVEPKNMEEQPTNLTYTELNFEEETPSIDTEKAVRYNKKYQAELWGSHIESIRKYFASKNFLNTSTDANPTNFAMAVARWQATAFKDKKSIDGVLGPISWSILVVHINAPQVVSPVQTPSRWRTLIKDTVSSPAIPLMHGHETFKRMVDAIKTANSPEHYIYILGWMLEVDFEMIPGDPTSTLFQLLQAASSRGVQIRVLIWNNPLYIKEITTAEGKINSLSNALMIKDNATFGSIGIKNAILKIRFLLSQAPVFLRFVSSWNDFVAKVNAIQNEGSHHEKVVVVKGSQGLIGFCGGIDINSNRVTGIDSIGRSEVLHDIHCEARGHAAWVLSHRFIWRWKVYLSQQTQLLGLKFVQPLLGEKEPLPAAVLPGPNVAQVKILQTYNHPGNNIKDRSIREAVKLAIMNARRSIHIEDQYMISLEIASWLNLKLANEPNLVSVTILTQDDEIAGNDLLFARQMRKKFIDQLQQGLAPNLVRKIFIKMLHRSVPPLAHHKIHSKVYIIDDELAIVGSAILSSRSMTLDSETAAIIFNDPGSPTNFALQLKTKETSDPNTNIVSYAPNQNVKDMDVRIIDELNSLSPAKMLALGLAGPAIALTIPKVISALVTQYKPAIIDIIDPDADNTQPQQEAEYFPDSLLETVDDSSVAEQSFETINDVQLEMETVTPIFSRQPFNTASFLPAAKNAKAIVLNKANLQKSGLSFDAVMNALSTAVDVTAIRQTLIAQNQNNPSSVYTINNAGGVVDAVFTEAVHQFQIASYINPKEHDGIMGVSTLDSLGFVTHGLRRKLSSAGFYGQSQLNRSDVRLLVSAATNNEFTNANWFNYIMYPSWLGIKIASGVHLLLLRKLREAEAWLLKQPKYQNMSPAALGKALGFTADTAYSAARLSADNQAMHAFGLAIDINVAGNPWIGAGWVQKDQVLLQERTRMIKALRAAYGNQSLPGDTVFAYLHSIAISVGKDTSAAFKVLKQRNDEFIVYLKSNSSELNYWKNSQSFANRNPLNGFLNHHPDLVYALRQVAGLAWGAIDFGPRASGDIMHFDLRTIGVGKILCEKISGYVPKSGHPVVEKEMEFEEDAMYESNDMAPENEFELHEAIEEAKEYETAYEPEAMQDLYNPEFETEEQPYT